MAQNMITKQELEKDYPSIYINDFLKDKENLNLMTKLELKYNLNPEKEKYKFCVNKSFTMYNFFDRYNYDEVEDMDQISYIEDHDYRFNFILFSLYKKDIIPELNDFHTSLAIPYFTNYYNYCGKMQEHSSQLENIDELGILVHDNFLMYKGSRDYWIYINTNRTPNMWYSFSNKEVVDYTSIFALLDGIEKITEGFCLNKNLKLDEEQCYKLKILLFGEKDFDVFF